jgi:hypothetical protein
MTTKNPTGVRDTQTTLIGAQAARAKLISADRAGRSRETDQEPQLIDGRRLGELAHRLIAEIVTTGNYRPTPRELIKAVGASPVTASAEIYKTAGRQALLGCAGVYFAFFAPPADWELIGCEIPGEHCRFDLVWRTPAGITAEEIKSGTLRKAARRRLLDDQVERQREAGIALWGDEFAGVRVIFLDAPATSQHVDAAGASRDLRREVAA